MAWTPFVIQRCMMIATAPAYGRPRLCQDGHTVMSAEKPTRRYQLRKRADAMEATRRRITEAAVELHGTVGPARTTMSAVAERAGVQRQTVYRHFADEQELLAACSGHFAAQHPWPDAARWAEIADPAERLRAALDELYAWYETTEAMWTNVLRDATLVAAVGPALEPFLAYLDERRARSPPAGARAAAAARCSSPRPATPSTSRPGARSRATAASAARRRSSSPPRWSAARPGAGVPIRARCQLDRAIRREADSRGAVSRRLDCTGGATRGRAAPRTARRPTRPRARARRRRRCRRCPRDRRAPGW